MPRHTWRVARLLHGRRKDALQRLRDLVNRRRPRRGRQLARVQHQLAVALAVAALVLALVRRRHVGVGVSLSVLDEVGHQVGVLLTELGEHGRVPQGLVSVGAKTTSESIDEGLETLGCNADRVGGLEAGRAEGNDAAVLLHVTDAHGHGGDLLLGQAVRPVDLERAHGVAVQHLLEGVHGHPERGEQHDKLLRVRVVVKGDDPGGQQVRVGCAQPAVDVVLGAASVERADGRDAHLVRRGGLAVVIHVVLDLVLELRPPTLALHQVVEQLPGAETEGEGGGEVTGC